MSSQHIPTRTLGKSGIPVSEIGMGLWAAGGDQWGPTDDSEVLSAIDAALDSGVTFFDTADAYGGGHSEELLGWAMQGRRDRFVVGTKIGWLGFDGDAVRTAYGTVDALIAGVEENLKRLDTDYIDLIQSHIHFREPTMEVFLEGFQRLQRDGKVRAYGVSTSDLDYFKTFAGDGGCSSLQVDYSILNRTAEADLLPYCQENNIGVIVRGSLAMGILTGKYGPDAQFADGDFRREWTEDPDAKRTFLEDLRTVEALRPIAGERSLAQLALQFVLAHPAVTTVIPGAKKVSQVQSNVAAATQPQLSQAELARIGEIVPPGGGRKIWPA
mgnify:CR=1 FL=1